MRGLSIASSACCRVELALWLPIGTYEGNSYPLHATSLPDGEQAVRRRIHCLLLRCRVMAEIPATRYVKSDDVYIAYQVLGEGPFDLLFVHGFVSNVEATWRWPELSAFFRRLASFCRLILFDKRGTGMSDRGSQNFTLEQRMHDVQAILDAVGSEQAALFGVSEGGPMSLLYAATYPQRTSALVLYGSYAKRSWAPDYPFGWNDEQWQRALDNIEHNWGSPQHNWSSPQALGIAIRAPSATADPQAAERLAAYLRASASPGTATAVMRMNREIDVRKVLSATRVPTLILHRTADPFIEVEHARYLARHIVGAKLIEFSGEVHLPWLGDRDAILDKVEQYLTGGRRVHEPERLLATVLFVDIVGSTERAAALGDLRWRELLETFYVRVREVLQVYRGREIRTATTA
jgi:pimeloyl-ACP methyl ester carboxylesterase